MKHLTVLFLIFCSILTSYAEVVPAVVKIYDESELEQLVADGVQIERRRGDLLLCYFPDTDEDRVIIPNTRSTGRKPVIKNKIIQPVLDKAVSWFDATDIQTGKGFPAAYTGKNVVVGICDIGFDPFHPTFLDSEGRSRVKRITQYKEYEGVRLELEGDEAYAEWITDSISKNHATHVGGIIAGNGAGTPYRGVAYDADFVVSLSCLTDFGLLMGVEDIIDYAKEVGKPAVINLSMGCYTGAHDGTSLFSQYLDLCADDAIIVLSAGNEGNNTNYMTYDFPNAKPLEFRLGNRKWDQKKMYGMTDIWNATSNPLKITICVYDDETHEVVHEYEPLTLRDWETVRYEWNPENPLIDGLSLNGYLTVTGGVDPENGRYEIGLIYDFESSRLIGSGWAKDLVSVKLEGTSADDIDIFADGTYTRLMAMSGYPSPTTNMTISDLACGHRVVSVGMYANRESYPATVFDEWGNAVKTEWKPLDKPELGTVVYSSYGTLRDGRSLPSTVGPGDRLVSAFSRPFRESFPDAEEYYLDDNRTPWIAMSGTSMSSPFVAGYIATWLEAVPDLKVEDVLRVIAASNRHDIPEPSNPRNINGYFNPAGALRYALDPNSVTQIKNPQEMLSPSDKVEVYGLSGVLMYSGIAEGCPALQKGIYIVKTPFGMIKKMVTESQGRIFQ